MDDRLTVKGLMGREYAIQSDYSTRKVDMQVNERAAEKAEAPRRDLALSSRRCGLFRFVETAAYLRAGTLINERIVLRSRGLALFVRPLPPGALRYPGFFNGDTVLLRA